MRFFSCVLILVLTTMFMLILCPKRAYGDWERQIVGSAPDGIVDLALADGRNDGILRIYGIFFGLFNGLYEFAYLGGNQWDQYAIDVGPHLLFPCGLETGHGRNDGVNRLYVTEFDYLFEYSYEGGIWTSRIVADRQSWTGIAMGAGKNDDTTRVYAISRFIWSDIKGRPFIGGGVFEFTYSDGYWKVDTVDYDSIQGGYTAITIGAGRNDGVMRIYAGTEEWDVHTRAPLYEYTYEGSGWNKIFVGELSDYYQSIFDIKCGVGRNDGITRVYAILNGNASAYELTFEDSLWYMTDIAGGNSLIGGNIDIGIGRNDDTARLYVTQNDLANIGDSLFEYTFRDTAWACCTVGWVDDASDSAYLLESVVVGEGRNDGKVRVYSGSAAIILGTQNPVACLYEFTYEQEDIEEDAQMGNRNSAVLLHTAPNPFSRETDIVFHLLVPSHATLDIYDIAGRKVTTLVDKYKEAGTYTVQWDGRDKEGRSLSRGIYVIYLDVGGTRISKNIIFIK